MQVQEGVKEYLCKWFSNDELESILEKVTTPPSCTTLRIKDLLDHSIDESIGEDVLSLLKAQERDNFKWILEKPKGMDDIVVIRPSHSVNESCKQLYPRIAVDQYAASAIMRGADLMAVGVIGLDYGNEDDNSDNIRKGRKCSIVVDVNRVLIRGQNISVTDSPLPENAPFIANGEVIMTRKEIFNSTSGSGIAVKITERIYPAVALNDIIQSSNSLFLQNLPSAVASHVLNPLPGERVYDMCSAPGGKTTHLAQLMNNIGLVVATERSKSKVNQIKSLCKRLELSCVTVLPMDSTKVLKISDNSPHKQLFQLESFDKILLDPPCSGFGLRPRFQDSNTVEGLKQHAEYQRKFFYSAVGLLKKDGILVYSTCTLHPEENECNVAWALKTFPNLKLIDIDNEFKYGSPGLPNCGLSSEECSFVQRFSPLHSIDSPAFFISKFKKTSS